MLCVYLSHIVSGRYIPVFKYLILFHSYDIIIGRFYMQIREYSLPSGWFPRDSGSVRDFLIDFSSLGTSRAVISPHAGWYYCGRIAAHAISSLQPEAETVIVLGGHLAADSAPLFAMEDAVRTPFGSIPIDSQLRSLLIKELNGSSDRFHDNTIEVLLPMVHYFFPKSNLIWLRLPANEKSLEAGKIISQITKKLDRTVNIIASTDLTHYGQNYGFTSHGTGQTALRWVREVNDAKFIEAIETGNSVGVLGCAEYNHAACSAGAVLGVMGFAEAEELGSAKLLEYGTSADVDKDNIPGSFVGYAAMVFGE
jgi:hypothetical protein